MKHLKTLTIFLALVYIAEIKAQTGIYNQGNSIFLANNAVVFVKGNVTNTSGGSIVNDGIIQFTGDFTNNSLTSLANSNTPSVFGKMIFSGQALQSISGPSITEFEKIEINNAAGIILAQNAIVGNEVNLAKGPLYLSGNNLAFNSSASITGADSSKFLVTGSSGNLTQNVFVSGVLFPVGYSDQSDNYNPLTISGSSAATNFSVRSQDNLLSQGSSGTALATNNVTNGWYIQPENPAVTASVMLKWNTGDEPSGFNTSNNAAIWYNGTEYIAVSDFGPSTLSKTAGSISNWGWFGVGDANLFGVRVFARAFLQGAYNATTHLMTTTLNSSGYLPLSHPYTGSPWNCPSQTALTSIPNAGITDWVYMQLRTTTTNQLVKGQRAGFIFKDGNLYSDDNTEGIYFPGINPGSYYIALYHRNHLPIMSASKVSLPNTSVTKYDFTTALDKAYENPLYASNNAQQAPFSDGKFGMIMGNASRKSFINYYGANKDPLAISNEQLQIGGSLDDPIFGYFQGDVNMNGILNYYGSGKDPLFIQNVLLNTNIQYAGDIYEKVYTHVP